MPEAAATPRDRAAAGEAHKARDRDRREAAAAEKARAKAEAAAVKREVAAAAAATRLRDAAAASTAGLAVQWGTAGAEPGGPAPPEFIHIWRAKHAAGAASAEPEPEAVPAPASAPAPALAPVVLWLHGGGWRFGTHAVMPPFIRGLTAAGFGVVSVGCRKSKVAVFPACLHDCKAAVRWVRAHGAAHGLDGGRVGVLGNSAGAHLAALLGLTAGLAELEGRELGWATESSAVSAVVAIAGACAWLERACTCPPAAAWPLARY